MNDSRCKRVHCLGRHYLNNCWVNFAPLEECAVQRNWCWHISGLSECISSPTKSYDFLIAMHPQVKRGVVVTGAITSFRTRFSKDTNCVVHSVETKKSLQNLQNSSYYQLGELSRKQGSGYPWLKRHQRKAIAVLLRLWLNITCTSLLSTWQYTNLNSILALSQGVP